VAAFAPAATLAVFHAHMVPTDPILAMLGDLAAGNPKRFRAQWGLIGPWWRNTDLPRRARRPGVPS
jgi:hypothetical protein